MRSAFTDAGGASVGPLAATNNGDGTWSVPAQDLSGLAEGAVTLSVAETDAAGNAGAAVTRALTKDTTGFGVSVEQAAGQADPTNVDSAAFVVTFDEAIDPNTFEVGDIALAGTAGTVTSGPTATDASNTAFTFTVTGMGDGDTVSASIAAGEVANAVGNPNEASTSVDGAVRYDVSAPTLLAIDAGIAGDDTVNSAERSAVTVTGTGVEAGSTIAVTFSDGAGASVGPVAATNNGDGSWSLSAQDLTPLAAGPVTVSAVETDAAGNTGPAVTRAITLALTGPSVTVEQAATQADPTPADSAVFTVTFSAIRLIRQASVPAACRAGGHQPEP